MVCLQIIVVSMTCLEVKDLGINNGARTPSHRHENSHVAVGVQKGR